MTTDEPFNLRPWVQAAEHRALLVRVLEDPGNDTPRLIMSDWLEEHDWPIRAEFIRLQCELARIGHPTKAEAVHARYKSLRRRERELLEDGIALVIASDLYQLFEGPFQGRLRRGFFAQVTCPAADWLCEGPRIVWAQPIECVVLVGVVPLPVDGEDKRYYWALDRGLPDCLYDALPCADCGPGLGWKRYPSRAAALDALSAACLLYAHAPTPDIQPSDAGGLDPGKIVLRAPSV